MLGVPADACGVHAVEGHEVSYPFGSHRCMCLPIYTATTPRSPASAALSTGPWASAPLCPDAEASRHPVPVQVNLPWRIRVSLIEYTGLPNELTQGHSTCHLYRGPGVSDADRDDAEEKIRTGTALRAVERVARRLGAGRPARGASVVIGLTAREAAGDATMRPGSGSSTVQVGCQGTWEEVEESRDDEESEGASVGHGCGVLGLGRCRQMCDGR